MTETGLISKLDRRGLFGRIRPDTGGDIFFHQSDLLNRRFANLATGFPVTFTRSVDRMIGKPIARNVRVMEP